jgi:transposase
MIERILISEADRERLERLVRDRNTPQKVVWRAQIVLLASDGLTAEAIAAAVGKSLLTVRRWRNRYAAEGPDGLLKDATRPSRVPPLAQEKITACSKSARADDHSCTASMALVRSKRVMLRLPTPRHG